VQIAVEALDRLQPAGVRERLRAAGRRLAAELEELVGDGVLLYPTNPWVAPRHGVLLAFSAAVAYTAVFNLAGTPVTQAPVGLDDRGLPLGVQVAARRGADHVTIAVACALEEALGGWVPPRSPS